MKEVRICYSHALNAGDAINPIVIEKIMGYKPIWADQFTCQISGIGSGLRRFFVDLNSQSVEAREYIQNADIVKDKPIIIWSAGFIQTPEGTEVPISQNLQIASVRGNLSKHYVEKIVGKKIDCTVGDGGLLVSMLDFGKIDKKYHLGIIPHRSEKNEAIYRRIAAKIQESIIIDIECEDVMTCIRQISECECIISSSLHGLIFADSFCIPNKHVVFGNKLWGDGIKFKDYYSVFGLEDIPQNLNVDENIDVNKIIDSYKITKEMVVNKQQEIIKAFHRFL